MQIVYSAEQLSELRRQWLTMPSLRQLPEYILDIPELTGMQNDRFSRQLNHHLHACGCIAARWMVVIACLVLVVEHALAGGLFAGLGPGLLLLDAGIILSAFFAGRFTAMLWSRVRLLQLSGETVRRSVRNKGTAPHAGVG